MTYGISSNEIRSLARQCGFELAGVARAEPASDAVRFHQWTAAGFAGDMRYLTDHRAQIRDDPRQLLPQAQSIVCVGKLYNTPQPYSTRFTETGRAWISRYAWGADYHDVVRRGIEELDAMLRDRAPSGYASKVCVDTAPLLERSYARAAGLGWIGKNGCLINQQSGSWFFLGELLTSLALPPDSPQPERCGTCTRCIDACPTAAIVPFEGGHAVDARLCLSYLTIELRGPVPEPLRAALGRHIFGCDICQDVCPWNRRAPSTTDPAFSAQHFAPPLERLASITEDEFRAMFRRSPVSRARYRGFLRNVATAMGANPTEAFREPLAKLAASPDDVVARHARWALARQRPLAPVLLS